MKTFRIKDMPFADEPIPAKTEVEAAGIALKILGFFFHYQNDIKKGKALEILTKLGYNLKII